MRSNAPSSFFGLPAHETEARCEELGGRAFHARIVRREVFENQVLDYDAMTSLPRVLRERLAQELPLMVGREVTRTRARDGTIKLLLEYPGRGADTPPATVETAYIPSHRRGHGATLCVSTQVGCAVGCPFCASGRDGLLRNLDTAEILEQYLRGRALGPLSRSVVMGIGEPLLNFANLERALRMVREEIGLGARKITVSSVGFPARLARIAKLEPRFQLAISLHSPDDALRAELVPAMAATSVEAVLQAGDDWFRQTGREVTYEYVLLAGVNDGVEHAQRLGRRLSNRRATVNLIPYNPVAGDRFERPPAEQVERFCEALTANGVVATVRWSRGMEAQAACGQLRMHAVDRA